MRLLFVSKIRRYDGKKKLEISESDLSYTSTSRLREEEIIVKNILHFLIQYMI